MEAVHLQLSRYVIPITIVLGTIGAVSNQILFYFRKQLRTTSCALYFRALSFNDFLVLWLIILPQWFRDQFQIDPSEKSQWYCKLYQYLTYALYSLSPYFIVLACFDRLCTSSTNARLRRIATIRIASFLIPSMAIVILLIYSYTLIWTVLVVTPSNTFCAIINPIYSRMLAFSLIFLYCFIPPFLMIVFCSATLILLRQHRRRIMPVNQAHLRHRDNQLIKMLFMYVISNIICILPYSVMYFFQIYYYNNLSPLLNPLLQIFTILADVTYAASFYIYTLGTPFYRDELKNLLRSIWQRLHRHDNTVGDIQPRRKLDSTTV